jgi:predicted nucleotidyltransferase
METTHKSILKKFDIIEIQMILIRGDYMNKNIQNEIEKITNKIKDTENIKRIYLFGSYAYGSPNIDSDIDLCIISEGNKRKIEIMNDIREKIGYSINYPLDIIVYKPEEFNERANSKTSLENKISKNGVVIYEKRAS